MKPYDASSPVLGAGERVALAAPGEVGTDVRTILEMREDRGTERCSKLLLSHRASTGVRSPWESMHSEKRTFQHAGMPALAGVAGETKPAREAIKNKPVARRLTRAGGSREAKRRRGSRRRKESTESSS